MRQKGGNARPTERANERTDEMRYRLLVETKTVELVDRDGARQYANFRATSFYVRRVYGRKSTY